MESSQEVNSVSTGLNVPVQESTPATPVSSVEQDAKEKGGNGMLIGLILCLILAIGGIGFGVCEIMEGSAKQADYEKVIADLEMQKNELEKQNEELTARTASGTKNGEDDFGNTEIEDNESEEGFLTIKEWGLKVKIPENLGKVNYRYSDDDGGSSVFVVGIAKKYLSEGAELPFYVDFSKNPDGLTGVRRVTKAKMESCGDDVIWNDDEYAYCIGVVDAERDSAKYAESETTLRFWDSIELVRKMMRNKENYSKI